MIIKTYFLKLWDNVKNNKPVEYIGDVENEQQILYQNTKNRQFLVFVNTFSVEIYIVFCTIKQIGVKKALVLNKLRTRKIQSKNLISFQQKVLKTQNLHFF